jgi:hypothetical protein
LSLSPDVLEWPRTSAADTKTPSPQPHRGTRKTPARNQSVDAMQMPRAPTYSFRAPRTLRLGQQLPSRKTRQYALLALPFAGCLGVHRAPPAGCALSPCLRCREQTAEARLTVFRPRVPGPAPWAPGPASPRWLATVLRHAGPVGFPRELPLLVVCAAGCLSHHRCLIACHRLGCPKLPRDTLQQRKGLETTSATWPLGVWSLHLQHHLGAY